MSAELSVGEFQTRLFRDFKKGRADDLDDGPSLGHMRETTEAEVVGHCHCSLERGGEREAGTRIFGEAKGRRDPQPNLPISRAFGEVINVSDKLDTGAEGGHSLNRDFLQVRYDNAYLRTPINTSSANSQALA